MVSQQNASGILAPIRLLLLSRMHGAPPGQPGTEEAVSHERIGVSVLTSPNPSVPTQETAQKTRAPFTIASWAMIRHCTFKQRHISERRLFGIVACCKSGDKKITQYAQSYASRYWDRNASLFGNRHVYRKIKWLRLRHFVCLRRIGRRLGIGTSSVAGSLGTAASGDALFSTSGKATGVALSRQRPAAETDSNRRPRRGKRDQTLGYLAARLRRRVCCVTKFCSMRAYRL